MNLGNGSLKGAWGEKRKEGKRRMSCIREMKEEIERGNDRKRKKQENKIQENEKCKREEENGD